MSPEVTQEYTEFRRRQILVAAWQAFAEKGVRGTTMRDIAEALGLSTGVVYTYFDGKEEIVRALLARSLDQNERLLEDLAQKESVTQAVEGLFDYFLQCCPGDAFRNSAQANLRYWSEALERDDFSEGFVHLHRRFRDGLAAITRKGVLAGELPRDFDAEAFAELIIALVAGLQAHSALLRDLDTTDYLRSVREVLLRMLRNPTQ